MNLKIENLFSKIYVISLLTPALSPLRGEGELSAVGWSCFATKLGSRVQYANMVSGNSPLSKKCNFFEHFFGTLSKIP
jgi:hypothetical protein